MTLLLFLLFVLCSCTTSEKPITDVNQQKKDIVTKQEGIKTENDDKPLENESNLNMEDAPVGETVKPIKPAYQINQANWSIEPIGQANEKVVLLTIDDAPDKYGLDMAKVLKDHNVPAIFFVNGHFIDTAQEEEVLKQIYELGFQIGNHTWSHKNLKELTEEEQFKEIMTMNEAIERITGERPKFFRAPFGSNTEYAKELIRSEDMVLMNWTYGYDFMKDYMNETALAEIMVHTNLLTNGANLLMHDREWTYHALGPIIEGLREKGYEFVNPELIETQ